MLFALICRDKPGHLQVRLDTRPAHLAWLGELGSRVKAGGPMLDETGRPEGSLVIVEAEDRATIESLAAEDPYAKAGLFASVEIKPWVWAVNKPADLA